MPTRRLTRLPRTQFSGLDFENIMEDITRLVVENPEFNEQWSDFLSSNAGRMMTELFAYIADQLSTRIDWMVNENFIGTATQKRSIMRILRLIGYNFQLPVASQVPVTITFDKPVGTFFLSDRYDPFTGDLDLFSLTARDRSGSNRTYEALEYDEENNRYEYKTGVEINTGTVNFPNLVHDVYFHEGRTQVETITVDTNNNFTYTLPQNPVIEDSVRVYMIQESSGVVSEELLEQVDSFLDPVAQRQEDAFGEENPIPYMINVEEDNRVTIEFGPTSLLPDPDRRPAEDDRIRIFYRVGGGIDGNLTRRSINTTRRLNINEENVTVRFSNNVQGTGGQDGEDPERASVFAPLEIRTAQKAVTEEDYDILLGGDNTILKTKSYGNNNMPANLYNQYGVFIRPLEVWNYVLQDKPGWEDLPPSEYNNFEWIGLRLQNRFNERHSFTDGSFNQSFTAASNVIRESENIEWQEDKEIHFKNFIEIEESLHDYILNGQDFNNEFIMKITTKELSENFFALASENNIFNEVFEKNNNGEFSGEREKFSLEQDVNAYYISPNDLEDNVNMGVNKYIKISIDNREPMEIDLSEEAEDVNNVTPFEIRDKINNILTNSSYYNDGDDGAVKGEQKMGFSISDLEERTEMNRNTDYYFKVNGLEYYVNSGDEIEGPTYSELKEKIQNTFSFKVKGNFINGSNEVELTEGCGYEYFIKKGYKIKNVDDESNVISEDVRIEEYNILENTIVMSDDANASATDHEFYVYFYDIEEEEDSGYYDFKIINSQEEPVGPIWIQKIQDMPEGQDFYAFFETEPGDFVKSTGVKGEQKLGINATIMPTRGFQAFSEDTSGTVPSNNQTYRFKIDIDENPLDGGADIEVLLDDSESLQGIVDKLIDEFNDLNAEVETAIDDYGRIRITSNTQGSNSKINIYEPSGSNSLLNLLDGVEDAVDGVDEPKLEIDEGEYYFYVNNYQYTIEIDEDDNYIDLKDKLQAALYDHNYTVDIIEEEWQDEIRITFENSDKVHIQDGNLFEKLENLIVLGENEKNTIEWKEFDYSIGGGDYSHVARIFEIVPDEGIELYVSLYSPCFGEYSSIVHFLEPDDLSISSSVFNQEGGEDVKNYGYMRATILLNPALEDRRGDIILENGSLRFFDDDFIERYYHYIYERRNEIIVGRYHTDNFEEDDASYREPARRIYNTHYDDSTLEIDVVNSDFNVRFTKEETDRMSVFAINNDWDLEEATPARIESVEEPHKLVDEDHFLIRVNFDGVGEIEIDVTDNQGQSDEYSLTEIVDNINEQIRASSDYNSLGVYQFFSFATIDNVDDKIILRSPTNTNDSRITFIEPTGGQDATELLFGLSIAVDNYEHNVYPTGDYFIAPQRIEIEGNFSEGSDWITNISEEDLEQCDVGMKIFSVPATILESYIMEVDEDEKRIRMNRPAGADRSTTFGISNDLMTLQVLDIPDQESNVPDLDFYFHFVNDRRYVEDAFDGSIITGEQGEQIQTAGYPKGSLDEDIYDAFLSDKKIVGVNHVFKETRFTTFDIVGTIYYESTFARSDVEQRVEESLREAFSLENRDYAQAVARSRIMSIIHENEGVDYIEIDFLGTDATDGDTDVANTISASFDEIIVISEDRFFAGEQTHGIMFDYVISGVS